MISVLALSALLATVTAYDVSTGYADVDRPYNLPAHVFQPALDDPAATGTYGLSDFGPTTGRWDLEVLVARDVPLGDAQDDDGSNFGDKKVGQLTVLAMIAPDLDSQIAVTGDDDICVIVFRGFNNETNREAMDENGNCETLSSACRNDLVSAAEERDGCEDVDLPDSCSDYFPESRESWGFGFQQEAVSATGRYFGFLSNPQNRDSDEASLEYERAVTHTWPVILTWDNTTEFRCLRAFDRSDDVGLVTEAPDRDYSEYDSSDSGAATMSGSFVLSLGALFVVLLMA